MKKTKSNNRRRPAAGGSKLVWFILIVAALIIGYLGGAHPSYWKKYLKVKAPLSPSRRENPAAAVPKAEIEGKIYYRTITDGEQRLVPVVRDLPAAAPARAALELLLQAPPAGLENPLPSGVSLRGVSVKDGLARADFSRMLQANFAGGSDNEGAAVFAIVNTLTSLPGVKRVQILVEGQPIDSLGGHLDISQPLAYDGELVVASQ